MNRFERSVFYAIFFEDGFCLLKERIQLQSAIPVIMRFFKIECFSRTMVELIHDSLNLIIGYVLKAAAFGKVLPNQAVGILVKKRTLVNCWFRPKTA